MRCPKNMHRRSGFTLIELLMVIAILVALLLPALSAKQKKYPIITNWMH